jgi:glycerophosphoryl diester phosphodiesterase
MHFWSRTPGPLLYAHRGASSELPENTTPAFRRALELGADVLELDVHATQDRVFVVSHDPSAERTCNVPRRLADCTWSEVSSWDAGWGFVDAQGKRPYADKDIRLARFDSVLDEFRDAAFNVDVKEATDAEVRTLLSLLREQRAESRVLLTSFSWRCLWRIRRQGYEGALGLSQLDVVRLFFMPEFTGRLLPFGGIRAQVPPRSGPLDLSSPRFIEKCHRLGLKVDYWVINQPGEAARLLDNGADGIIADDVAKIAEVFAASERTAAWRARAQK